MTNHAYRRPRVRATRRGFTLPEMLISITLTMLVFAMAIPFFTSQTRAMSRTSGRLDAQLNASNAVLQIDRDLRAAGSNLEDRQPLFVQAQVNAVTFNTDMVSRTTSDLGAYYVDSTADDASTGALTKLTKVTLPQSSVQYPGDTSTTTALGQAETISLWVEPDTGGGAMAGGAGTQRLMRRVNRGPAQVVARGLVVTAADPVFRFLVRDASGRLRELAAAALPLTHVDHVHTGSGEKAASVRIDSIRAVRVRLTTSFRDPREAEARRTVERTIRMPNAGISRFTMCGGKPPAPTGVARAIDVVDRRVTINWSGSTDETGGERDVERYVVYRRSSATAAFSGDPLVSVAAGAPAANYSFVDAQVPSGTWVYGVAAMDCGRVLSATTSAASVVMPVP